MSKPSLRSAAALAPLVVVFVACAPAARVEVRETAVVSVTRPAPPPPAPVIVERPVAVVQPITVIEQPAPVVVYEPNITVQVIEFAPGPAPAEVVLESLPASATVYVDGVFVARGPLHLRINAGVHTVRVEAPGYAVIEQRFTVNAREIVRPTINLVVARAQSVQQFGNLEVYSKLEGALVLLDGRERGWVKGGQDLLKHLSSGEHMLELVWKTHAYAERVRVDAGRTDAVDLEASH
jgi:hypothetical protein